VDIAFGWNLLAQESTAFRRPIVVTTPTPWTLVRPHLASAPSGVVQVESLERRFLESVSDRPIAGDVVLGIGGGMVMDAAKYMALRWSKPLILLPTITSGNGPFTPSIAVREGGRPVGMRGDVLADRVLVDYGIIRAASPELNRSGIGDVLYLHTGEFDWRLAAHRGPMLGAQPVPWDGVAADVMRETVNGACRMAREIGSVSPDGIRALMEGFHTSAMLHERLNHPQVGAGSEHLFAWNLEATTGRQFVHGQVVCLGVVIMATLQRNDPEKVTRAIENARVVFRPRDLGLTWDEVERTLVSINDYNQKIRHFYTICDEIAWDSNTLQEVRAAIW
jgi:glycerol dehydrogenase-like iron-containing ADH family enzyme